MSDAVNKKRLFSSGFQNRSVISRVRTRTYKTGSNLIVVQMRIEDFQRRLRTAANRRGKDNVRSDHGARDNT